MKTHYFFFIILFIVTQCNLKKKDQDKSPNQIAMDLFGGTYKLEDDYANVRAMHQSFEVEVQFMIEPVIFFFDELDKNGNFVYQSDDKLFSFIMQPDHKTGMFYKTNRPAIQVIKQQQ